MTAPPTTSTSLPRQAGGFTLVRELGRGGMGVVYEAYENASGRTVALKVLAADLALSPEAFERFQREARLAAAISDSRCVFVYGAHEIEGSPAISMELVGGETLQERISRHESIPIDTAVHWALDLIDGLEAAHRSGILHRDVKPSNCFVTTDGRVKVGDFGLSRSVERDIQLTQSGQFLGSPLYASPEQIRGREIDERSDQYSCAATLYAILTGRPPFPGKNVGEVLARILSESPVRPRSIRAEVPEELERVLLRALEREPARRFKDLEAFRDALQPFAGTRAQAATIPRRLGAWLVDFAVVSLVMIPLTTQIQSEAFNAAVPYPDRPWITVTPLRQALLGSIPIFYFGIMEALIGASVGKLLFGLRVVRRDGARAGWRAAWRALVYDGATDAGLIAMTLWSTSAVMFSSAAGVVPVAVAILRTISMRKRNGWRMLHELASDTRTIQLALPFRRPRRATAPPQLAAVARNGLPASLGAYRIDGVLVDSASGPALHGKDAHLERSVWIQLRERGSPSDESRRGLARPTRLRWLESLDAGGSTADVFESPGGSPLSLLNDSNVRLDWPLAERALSQLVDELLESRSEGAAASQLWIDRAWNLRLLDEPLAGTDANKLAPLGLVSEAARRLVSRDAESLPQDLPLHAEPLVRRLIGLDSPFTTLEEVRKTLAESRGLPSAVEQRQRSAQLAVAVALPIVASVITVAIFLFLAKFLPQIQECGLLVAELDQGRVLVPGQHSDDKKLEPEDVRTRQLALAWELNHGLGPQMVPGLSQSPANEKVIQAALTEFPKPGEAESLAALDKIHEQRGQANLLPKKFELVTRSPVPIVGFFASAIWTGVALVFGVIFPGGLTLRAFGMALRTRRGKRGSRLIGLARTALCGVPLVIGFGIACLLVIGGNAVLGETIAALTTVGGFAALAFALAYPNRSPIDRIIGTRLVPR